METRKKHLHQSSYFGDQPVRLYADRVPTFTVVPTDAPDSSKIVLNKYGWNSKWSLNGDPGQKSSDQDEESKTRSILRETNDNFSAGSYEWNFSSQPVESRSESVTTNSNNSLARSRKAYHNSHADATAALVKENGEPSLRLFNKNDHFYTDAEFHKTSSSHRKEEVTLGSRFPLNGDLQSKLNSNDERPIFPATSLHVGNSTRGNNDRRMVSERLITHDRNHQQRYDADETQAVRQAKLDLKVQLHKDQDGLERVRQLVAKQRIEERDHRGQVIKSYSRSDADHDNDIFHHAAESQLDNLSVPFSSGKNAVMYKVESDSCAAGHGDLFSDESGKTRYLHRSDDPVRSNKKIRCEPRVVSIPRKVTQAAAPPSYKGFCEVGGGKVINSVHGPLAMDSSKKREFGTSASEPHVIQPASVTGESYRSTQAKAADVSRHKMSNTHAADGVLQLDHPTSNKNASYNMHKKLAKPSKTDINVRSWRAGLRVVEQQLGKMPKTYLSPVTKGNSSEQIPVVPNLRSASIPTLSYDAEHGEKSGRAAADDTDGFRSLGMMFGDHDGEIGHSLTDATGEKMAFDELLNRKTNLHRDLEAEKDEEFDIETDDSKSDKTDAEQNEIMHPSMHTTAAVPSKAKPVSLQKRKKKILNVTEEKEKEHAMKRDRSYDKEEVKKYIAKQKAERTKKVKEELREKKLAEENRQRQLDALSRKQKESAGSKLHTTGKGKPRMGFRDNGTDSDGPHSIEVSSSEERNSGQFTIPIENMNGFKLECNAEARTDEIVADFVEAKVTNRIAAEPTKTSNVDHLGSAVSLFKTEEESLSSSTTRNSHGVRENSGHGEIINSKVSDVSLSAQDLGVVPKSRNHAERLALLEQAARSLTSRLNLQRNTFAGAFNARNDDSLKSSMVLERNSTVSVSNAPKINGSFVSHSLNNGRQFEEAVNDDSDSTLTEESVGQPEKTSSLRHFMHDGINTNIGLKPTGHKVEIRREKRDRKKADIEKWVTTRSQRGSSEESTLTGPNISDSESESRNSINSASASLPVRLTESGVTAGPHSEYVLRLRMLQQSHCANMLSLQAKSRQDFILASRRPLLRNDSTNSDQNETVFQEATSANVLNATPFAKADTSLINTDQTQDLKLAKSHDLSSFNGTKSMLPSGIILAHEAAANDSLGSDVSSCQENGNISLSNNDRKSPSETDLDASQTESEMERSMRDILPSEKQIKKLRQHGSLTNVGPAIDHSSVKHIFDSESFDSFSLNMVHTYLTQEQSRMHHQHMLLKLREQALAEKTRAHLAWLEQQKLQRKKGSDDYYPVIRQKQKEILEKHKREKASLQALQSLAQQALNIGHGSMSNLESIKYMQHAALKCNQNPKVRKWLDANRLTPRILSSDSDVTVSGGSDPEQLSEGLKEVGYECDDVLVPYSELPNEDQQSGENAADDSSRSPSLQKDEVGGSLHLMAHTDVGHTNNASPAKEKIAQKLKMQMDSRYLTIREKKLRQRRLDAERLLAWKNRLDKEEEEVHRLEMEAAQKIVPKKETSVGTEPELAKLETHDRGQTLIQYKDCCTSPIQSLSTASLVEDDCNNGQLKQTASPVTLQKPRRISSSASKGPMITGDKKALLMHEFNKSQDSVDALPVINMSPKRSKLPPKAEEIQANGLFEHINQKQRESMSETEDSFSALVSETTTDQSELEHQTKALQEELRRKRMKVENLRKLKKREEMKAKEDCLKKQIELADEEIKKLSAVNLKHSEVSIPTSLPQKEQFIRGLSLNETSKNIADEEPVSADKRSEYLLDVSPGTTKTLESTEDISIINNTSSQQSIGQLPISRPNYSSMVLEAENSSKIIELVKSADMPQSNREQKIISEVEDVACDKLKLEGSEESFGEVDVDDFFDRKIDTAVPSSNAFTILSRRESDEKSGHEKKDEFDFEESEKSVSSVASKDSKLELFYSAGSSKSNCVLKSKISDELDNKHETASQASEKSLKSVSSKKSENLERIKPTELEITATDGEQLKEEKASDESVLLENSVHSTASSASSKHSEHSHHGKLHSDMSSSETIGQQKNATEDSGSADSVKSSEKYSQFSKISDLSKKSQDGKETARSLSKSYSEDFSSASRRQSKKDSPDLRLVEADDLSANDSEAEEVKTEDDVRSLLSEDEDTSKSEIGVGKAAESEVALVKSTVEDVKEFSKNSLLYDDNILKEHLPEIPSETDLNSSADRTLPGDEHSLSGAGDSELERVISSAAAAVELFGTGSPETPSIVTKDASFGSQNKGNADLIIDGATKNLVSEAVSEVLAVKSKRELSLEKSSLDQNDSASLSKSPESTKPQHPASSLPLFDNDWWDGEYLDDDFGWPSSKPPPPYEQKSAEESEDSEARTPVNIPEPVVKISEPAIVVPHTTEEILKLADEVVDIFWHLRRCGESWDNVEPTADYFGADGNTATPELHSRHMYKQLIFDTVAEFLQEMYRDEDSTESVKFFQLIPPRPLKWVQYYKEKTPPTTLDALRPVVQSYVMSTVGQQIALQKFPRKWLSRRKDDGVDRVLTKELHEEEPEWVSYEEDTVKVKFQLAESIFQILLTDAARTLVNVHERILTNEKSKT